MAPFPMHPNPRRPSTVHTHESTMFRPVDDTPDTFDLKIIFSVDCEMSICQQSSPEKYPNLENNFNNGPDSCATHSKTLFPKQTSPATPSGTCW
ncbi:hypothetical protein AGR1B_Cc140298 [Agrobacterium fabacearum S56]|nr:hypothetical protein AGR1B_Cc140298 [Agrobacterium fabacearum S56]